MQQSNGQYNISVNTPNLPLCMKQYVDTVQQQGQHRSVSAAVRWIISRVTYPKMNLILAEAKEREFAAMQRHPHQFSIWVEQGLASRLESLGAGLRTRGLKMAIMLHMIKAGAWTPSSTNTTEYEQDVHISVNPEKAYILYDLGDGDLSAGVQALVNEALDAQPVQPA